MFLIDMNRLFEAFVTRLLTDTLQPHGIRVLPQHRTPSIVVDEDLGTTYARVIPDLLVDLPTGERIPADAKYKRYDDRRVDRGDVYQAFLYAFAYAYPGAGSPSSLILYPPRPALPDFDSPSKTPAVYVALESPLYPSTSNKRSNDDTTPAAPRTGRCCLLSMTTHSPP